MYQYFVRRKDSLGEIFGYKQLREGNMCKLKNKKEVRKLIT